VDKLIYKSIDLFLTRRNGTLRRAFAQFIITLRGAGNKNARFFRLYAKILIYRTVADLYFGTVDISLRSFTFPK